MLINNYRDTFKIGEDLQYEMSITGSNYCCAELAGVGFGFMYIPAIVIVGYYFDKRRALATGIAVCGSGIGTVVLAPVATILLDLFSWRGTNIILAGIILHGMFFGALYRPLIQVNIRLTTYRPLPCF